MAQVIDLVGKLKNKLLRKSIVELRDLLDDIRKIYEKIEKDEQRTSINHHWNSDHDEQKFK